MKENICPFCGKGLNEYGCSNCLAYRVTPETYHLKRKDQPNFKELKKQKQKKIKNK